MANPRKFSDKLEIIRRKEEEANAAFVKIMREVSDARKTTGPGGMPPPASWARGPNHELMNMKQRFKGGSLPNVNMSQSHMAMQGVYSQMADIYGNRPVHHPQSHAFIGHNIGQAHLRRMEPPSGPIYPSKNKRSYTASAPYHSNIHHAALQQSNSLMPESHDSGSSWRRAQSDSSIQQTLQQPPVKNGDGTMQQQSSPRMIPNSPLRMDSNEPRYVGSPPVSLSYSNDTTHTGKHMQGTANTSSLPDLSNLSIPSPIQTPLDAEQDNQNNVQQSPEQHTFQVPYRVPPRRGIGKQIYPRMKSTPDVIESMQRERELNLNLFPGSGVSISQDKLDGSINTNSAVSNSAPLSPVTPPPYYWNSTPMSPLATSDLMQHVSSQQQHSELQQQMSQFQIHGDNVNNGMGNPPPYPYISENDINNFNYPYSKQSVYRINSGPAQLPSQHDPKFMCDRQLNSELLKLKAQDASNSELSEADLNSVRVALDPLNFEDVQILSGHNTELVDQSAEEGFRLERAGYQ